MQCHYTWDDDQIPEKAPKPYLKRRPKNINYHRYCTAIYPTDAIKTMKFESSEQVSTFLLRNAMEIGYCKWQLFDKYTIDKGSYIKIVYLCRETHCDATLVYLQKKDGSNQEKAPENGACFTKKYYLALSTIVNKHRHYLDLRRQICNEANVRQYLHDLPVQQKVENHIQTIKDKFNIKASRTKYIRNRLFWKFENQDDLLSKLTQSKVSFRRKIDVKGHTTLLLLVSQTMKSSYLQYGDNLTFDLTYRLLKKKVGDERAVGVGFFVGQDTNSRIVLFGVATMEKETVECFQLLFGYFFQVMGALPETIVTDDQKAIGIALQKLKIENNYNYVHLLDWLHKMMVVQRATKREPCAEQLFALFCRLMKEPSKQVFADISRQIADILQKKQRMLNFLEERHKYCLSQVPYRFFSFGISSARAQSFNALVKRSISYQTNIGRFLYFMLRIEKRLLNRMKILSCMSPQITKYLHDPQIQLLSKSLQHIPFQQIRQYYQQSRTLPSPSPSPNPLTHTLHYQKYDRNYIMHLQYSLSDECWRCECGNNFRTGLPCAHLVAIVRIYGGCIGYYVSQRWLHGKDGAKQKKEGRPSFRPKRI